MVDMQVCTDHDVHILGFDASGPQAVQIGKVQLMEPLEQRQCTALVVAAPGIDQDRVALVPDHPRVHAGHQLPTRLVPEALTRQDRVLFQNGGIEVGKQKLRRKARRQHLLDARYMVRTDFECLHLDPFPGNHLHREW